MGERLEPTIVGRLSFPVTHANASPGVYKVVLQPEELMHLHAVMAR